MYEAKSDKIERRNKLFNNNRDSNAALSKLIEQLEGKERT